MNIRLLELLDGFSEAMDTHLIEVAGTSLTPAKLVIATLLVIVTFWASSVLQRVLAMGFRRRGLDSPGSLAALKRLLHYLVLVVGMSIALQALGIQLGALFAAGAIFAVGLGFAMQNIAQNFVSGFILLLERSILPGHILQLEGRTVKVRKMGIRSTVVRSLDGEDLIVPNANLVQGTVNNLSLLGGAFRLRAAVGVHYSSDMTRVREVLEAVGAAAQWRSHLHDPVVLLRQFGSSSVDWELSVWTEDPWRAQRRLSQLLQDIWYALAEAGITIAYPQLDVHLDVLDPEAKHRIKAALDEGGEEAVRVSVASRE